MIHHRLSAEATISSQSMADDTSAPGWAGVKATHTGPYLGCPATGNQIEFNGLDWWKREGEMYVENWVFVDMVHLFRQLGVDLFERLAEHL